MGTDIQWVFPALRGLTRVKSQPLTDLFLGLPVHVSLAEGNSQT